MNTKELVISYGLEGELHPVTDIKDWSVKEERLYSYPSKFVVSFNRQADMGFLPNFVRPEIEVYVMGELIVKSTVRNIVREVYVNDGKIFESFTILVSKE
jgi:hypothetical protein